MPDVSPGMKAPDPAGMSTVLADVTAAGRAPLGTAEAGKGAQPGPVAVGIGDVPVAIATRVRDGNHHFEVRLDPPELGQIEVHLEVDRDGRATARLMADRSETLDLLRRDAPALERALQSAGLKTGEGGLNFSLREHAFAERQHAGTTLRRTMEGRSLESAAPAVGYGPLTAPSGRVDLRV
jgi:hypothetical protein